MARQYVQIATDQTKGFISHDDQEIDGLSFASYPHGGNQLIVIDGETAKIDAWVARTGATKINKTEAKAFMSERLDNQKTLRLTELNAEIVVVQNETVKAI